MPVTNVLRPVSVRDIGGASAVPSGTLAAVTSDNSDATYISFPVASSGNNWSLRLEPHTPAAGYQRHRVRGRIRSRCDVGTLTESIDLGRGSADYINYQVVPLTTTFSEQLTDWAQHVNYGLNTVGALSDLNIGGGWPENLVGSPTLVQTAECYVDVDCRLWPTYTPEVRDNAGVNRNGGTVGDTNQPTMHFGTVGYDDLPAQGWAVAVNDAGGQVFSASGTGQPPSDVEVTSGLPDGVYTAYFSVSSIIRGSDGFEHGYTIGFTVENTVPPPSPPLVVVIPEFGGYRVSWSDPGGQTWDNDYVVAEVYRDDCTGSQRIATMPDGLSGSYLDLAIPQLDPQPVPGPDCALSSEACDITYRVRYWGYVSTSIEIPETIPDEMILGWPSTVASIPAGWSRVTSLDGWYPRGSSGTGAPSATGGSTSHTHTTPGHNHQIGSHSHGLGGNTDESNVSVTSSRKIDNSINQAEQAHDHPRPGSTVAHSGGNSSTTAPGTNSYDNQPLTREVVWIKSDGAQASYAVGVLGFSAENVSAWVDDVSSAGRFLRGAATGANGGGNGYGSTHSHQVNSHTHNGLDHDHTISYAGISNPFSLFSAESGSGTPRWLPRHTHPMDVINANTGIAASASGGTTSTINHEPPNRRLRVLRNTGGGIQTRIIGLYVGAVADLDLALTLCNGSNGTPDMRGWFARDDGPDATNSTGGSTTHAHTTPSHGHDIGGHVHDTNVGVSTTASYGRLTTGDQGDNPTTDHTHGSGNTASASPDVSGKSSGNTNTVPHLPPYKEVHFVRLDGTIDAGPILTPELRVSEFSSNTVPSFTHPDDLDRISTLTERMAVISDRSHAFPRLVSDSTPLDGGIHAVSTTLAGEDMDLTIAVEGLPAINRLEQIMASERIYWSPVGGTPGWYAPAGWTVRAPAPNVKVLQVTMVHQPWPETDDPEVYL